MSNNPLWVAIAEGTTAFAATNVDDLVILLLYFAQVNEVFRPRHVILGAYWGFAILVGLSLVGFFGGLMVAPAWIGLLGLLPILLGVKQLWQRSRDESPQVQTVSTPEAGETGNFTSAGKAVLKSIVPAQAYQVAVVTFANGGDNIGIYVPLFASSDLTELGVILLVFFLLKGVWCYAAYQLTRNPRIAFVISRYGQAIVPFVLIGLGLFILCKNGSYQLLFESF